MDRYSESELKNFGIGIERRGVLPVFHIENELAEADVTPYGAHILSFIPRGEKDLLWVSGKALYEEGKAIRGGIPVCWPWFGKAGTPSHGLARIAFWNVDSIRCEADGSTTVAFRFGPVSGGLSATLVMNAGRALTVSLRTVNGGTEDAALSEALHTYFRVSDIGGVRILGLKPEDLPCEWPGLRDGVMTFERETDLVCQCGNKVLVIDDPGMARKIRVTRFGSAGSVIWNPWIEKAAAMSDFGNDEYREMVCVEAANAQSGTLTLKPGAEHTLTTVLSLL